MTGSGTSGAPLLWHASFVVFHACTPAYTSPYSCFLDPRKRHTWYIYTVCCTIKSMGPHDPRCTSSGIQQYARQASGLLQGPYRYDRPESWIATWAQVVCLTTDSTRLLTAVDPSSMCLLCVKPKRPSSLMFALNSFPGSLS